MSHSIWGTITTLLPRRRLLWLGVLAVVLVALLWWLRSVIDLTPGGLRALLAPLGIWGALVIVAGIAVILVVPVVPATVLQVADNVIIRHQMGTFSGRTPVPIPFRPAC